MYRKELVECKVTTPDKARQTAPEEPETRRTLNPQNHDAELMPAFLQLFRKPTKYSFMKLYNLNCDVNPIRLLSDLRDTVPQSLWSMGLYGFP